MDDKICVTISRMVQDSPDTCKLVSYTTLFSKSNTFEDMMEWANNRFHNAGIDEIKFSEFVEYIHRPKGDESCNNSLDCDCTPLGFS